MSKLPKPLIHEAQLEDRLQNLQQAPSEPELAADWALRKELVLLKPEPLPSEFRRNLLNRKRSFRPRWASGMAVAASVSGILLLSSLMQPPQEEITISDAQNFQLAMQTISATSQRALNITGRELIEHVRMPRMELESLPYSDILQSMIAAEPETEITKEN